MFLSVRHKPHIPEAFNYEVINKETGEKIPRVIWANDETGRYRQMLTDETGNILVTHSGEFETFRRKRNGKIVSNGPISRVISKIFTGNIELRKII